MVTAAKEEVQQGHLHSFCVTTDICQSYMSWEQVSKLVTLLPLLLQVLRV
jgi:hypothetical protein